MCVELRAVIDIVVLQGNEAAVGGGANAHTLLRAWAMAHRLEHHLAAEHEFHRLAQLPRCRRRKCAMCPRIELAAETRTNELRDDPHVLLRQAEHLCEYTTEIYKSLRRLLH